MVQSLLYLTRSNSSSSILTSALRNDERVTKPKRGTVFYANRKSLVIPLGDGGIVRPLPLV